MIGLTERLAGKSGLPTNLRSVLVGLDHEPCTSQELLRLSRARFLGLLLILFVILVKMIIPE